VLACDGFAVDKKSNFDEIAAVSKQMEEAGITSNQYTPHTRESIQTMWQEVVMVTCTVCV
jgi:hypothetical protein